MLRPSASWRGLVRGDVLEKLPILRYGVGWLFAGLLLVGLVVTAPGCGHIITGRELQEEHPHLTLVEICMRPYGIPEGATVWATNADMSEIVTDREPERLREFAARAHYVFQFDPNAPQRGLASMRNPLPGVQCHLPMLSYNERLELQARRPAHTMADRVRALLREQDEEQPRIRRNRPFVGITFDDAFGKESSDPLPIDHPSAPEGYTLDGRPGKKPWQYHLGYSAHRAIAAHYGFRHPGHTVYQNNTTIKTIVDYAEGNSALLNWTNALLRPDIVDMDDKLLFEIKPRGDQHLIDGKAQADKYIGAINSAMPSTKAFTYGRGFSGNIGLRFEDNVEPWNLQWETTAPGVIQYRLRKLNPKKEDMDVNLVEAYRKAYEEDRWRDLTTSEMETYAELFHYKVELLMQAKDTLLAFQKIAAVPIDVVGTAAEFALSAALWSQMSGKVGWIPVVRKPPVLKPVVKIQVRPKVAPVNAPPPVAPKLAATPNSTPAINARSLGSDQRPVVTGSAKSTPTSPGKTNSGSTSTTK